MFLGIGLAPIVHAEEAPASPTPAATTAATAAVKQDPAETMKAAYLDMKNGQADAALAKVNGLIEADAQNKEAHLLRAMIYAAQEQWDKASSEYDAVLAFDPNDTVVKFDETELKFMQKKYDEARPGFLAIENDKAMGDFATYKVFLCDLFAGHDDVAAKDLDVINQVGENPSYYFANAAWDLAHNKTEEAADWLRSAERIYSNAPAKCFRYAASLKDHGYLPLHLSSAQ